MAGKHTVQKTEALIPGTIKDLFPKRPKDKAQRQYFHIISTKAKEILTKHRRKSGRAVVNRALKMGSLEPETNKENGRVCHWSPEDLDTLVWFLDVIILPSEISTGKPFDKWGETE